MKISEVTIENFRSFKKETIRFGEYVSLVGPNGAGKSTVLTALRIFFRDTADTATDLQSLGEEDFHNKDVKHDIVITVVFRGVEAEAQQELQHYYRNGQLVISAVAHWDEGTRRAEVVQHGERLVIKAFAPYFEALKAKKTAQDLTKIFEDIRTSHPDLPEAKSGPQRTEALANYEAAHPERLELVRSADQFYGFTKGESRLQKFIQWIFVPAVKDASAENTEGKKNALRLILERTVHSKISFEDALNKIRAETEEKYKVVLAERQNALRDLSGSLTDKLRRWAHPDASVKVQWEEDATSQIKIGEPLARALGREGMFEGDLSRFGHGYQRSYLLALLQELAACPPSGSPKLILACEEPELHQHPPQARHLAGVLHELSEKDTQVIVSTHSPYFVRGSTYQDVRLIRFDRKAKCSCSASIDLSGLSELIGQALGDKPITSNALELKIEQCLQERVGELFFTPSLVLVEGLEDAGYLEAYLALLDMREGLRRMGCHILHTGGKDAMIRPLAMARMLGIPTFAVIDADGDNGENREQNEKYNTAIMRLSGIDSPTPFPGNPLFEAGLCAWPTKVGATVQSEIGTDDWQRFTGDICKRNAISGAKLAKNRLFIGLVLARAWETQKKSPSLEQACRKIMAFATRAAATEEAEVARRI